MSRFIVVGGVNMDLHLFDVAASPGQAPLLAGRYLAQAGGKGGNVARAAARLGADVQLVARAGDDEFGRDCVAAIARDGVDTTSVILTRNAPTGFVAIELTAGRHRSLLFAPGANDHLEWSDIEPHVDGLERGDVVVAQAEIPAAALSRLAALVAKSEAALFLDPTPPDQVSAELLYAADVITPDRAEAAALVGRTDSSSLWPRLAAEELVHSGARRVLVKLGRQGALLADPDGVIRIPTLDVAAHDETGAGDVFIAALAVGRGEGSGWADAARFANVASALSVAETGLVLPDRATVDAAQRDQALTPETFRS
jgi:ribokinase